ncbi:MAG: DUF4412 domain-containing protein [Bacteroidetes bacterium]|nr:DUF4412 domain-containing protein [Bacteroidota bacterium]
MKSKILLSLFCLMLLTPSSLNGQVGNILKNRLNQAINKKIEEKVDTAINKKVREVETSLEEDVSAAEDESVTERRRKTFDPGAILGGSVTAGYEESYSFNNELYMVTEVYDGDEIMNMDYYIYWNDTDQNGGFESRMKVQAGEDQDMAMQSKMVLDSENRSFILLTDMGSTKFGIISEVPDENSISADEDDSEQIITKTGNTKVIAGYKCDEYLVKETDSDDHGKLWVTNDLKLSLDSRTYSKAGFSPYYSIPELRDGFVLATESYDGNNELLMRSETKEIKTGISHAISTAGYTLRQMNFDQAGVQSEK